MWKRKPKASMTSLEESQSCERARKSGKKIRLKLKSQNSMNSEILETADTGSQLSRENSGINNPVVRNGEPGSDDNNNIGNQENNSTQIIPNVRFWEIIRALFNTKYFFKRYSILTFCLNLFSIIYFTSDFVTDWVNAFDAYWFRVDENGNDFLFYFWLTVAVIALPSMVIMILSILFEQEDDWAKKQRKLFNNPTRADEDNSSESTRNNCPHGWCYYPWYILFHISQFSTVFRYFRTIYYGFKSKYMEVCQNEKEWKRYDQEYKDQLFDAAFVRLIESLLEAGPQVMLQIYLMIRIFDEILPITIISVVISGLGMTFSFVGYQRALRDSKGKEQLSVLASIILGVYITCFNVSRVLLCFFIRQCTPGRKEESLEKVDLLWYNVH